MSGGSLLGVMVLIGIKVSLSLYLSLSTIFSFYFMPMDRCGGSTVGEVVA